MKILKRFLLAFLAVLLVFEEWLWDALTILGRKLAVWLHLQRFEVWLRQTSPYVAVIAFAIPLLIVMPLNIAAVCLVIRGKIIRGVLLEIFAKLLATILIARVFALTRPQLLSFRWFKGLYNTINGWLAWAHDRLSKTTAYQKALHFKAALKGFFGQFKQKDQRAGDVSGVSVED